MSITAYSHTLVLLKLREFMTYVSLFSTFICGYRLVLFSFIFFTSVSLVLCSTSPQEVDFFFFLSNVLCVKFNHNCIYKL